MKSFVYVGGRVAWLLFGSFIGMVNVGANVYAGGEQSKGGMCSEASEKQKHTRKLLELLGYDSQVNEELYQAGLSENADLVRKVDELCSKGADINATDCLFWAATRGQENVVRTLLKYGADISRSTGGSAITLLQALAGCGKHNIIHCFCSESQNKKSVEKELEYRNKDGETALHYACGAYKQHSALQTCRVLLYHGARSDVASNEQKYPLHFAARSGREDIVKLLCIWKDLREKNLSLEELLAGNYGLESLTQGEQGTPDGEHEGQGGIREIDFTFDDDVSHVPDPVVNTPDKNGLTPLHHAAQGEDNVSVARVLIRYGANPSLTDHEGKTPCDLAVEKGHDEVVQFLSQLSE